MLMTFEGIQFEWIEREDNRVAVGADEVIIALDGNPAHVSRYMRDIFPDYKFQWSGGKVGRAKWYVYEPGVYQLIFSSSLANIAPQKIERFQRWVFQDVLPSIRTKAGYISPEASKEQLQNWETEIQNSLQAFETAYLLCEKVNDKRGMISIKTSVQNLADRLNGKTEENAPHDWLSISEILEQRDYNVHQVDIKKAIAQLGKIIKKIYREETRKEVKTTPKHLGSGHKSDSISVYPPDWFDQIESICVEYFTKKDLLNKAKKVK